MFVLLQVYPPEATAEDGSDDCCCLDVIAVAPSEAELERFLAAYEPRYQAACREFDAWDADLSADWGEAHDRMLEELAAKHGALRRSEAARSSWGEDTSLPELRYSRRLGRCCSLAPAPPSRSAASAPAGRVGFPPNESAAVTGCQQSLALVCRAHLHQDFTHSRHRGAPHVRIIERLAAQPLRHRLQIHVP